MRVRRILVVEDDERIRQLLVEYLRQGGQAEVASARDGAEALNYLGRNACDLVLLDLVMPHMSGMDLLASMDALLNDPSAGRLAQAPAVVVVTSMSDEAIPAGVIEQQFPRLVRSVIRKPVDAAALAERIDDVLRYDPPQWPRAAT
jgi:CheY-like chemotaxis protein